MRVQTFLTYLHTYLLLLLLLLVFAFPLPTGARTPPVQESQVSRFVVFAGEKLDQESRLTDFPARGNSKNLRMSL
jgi:hypothetical protein